MPVDVEPVSTARMDDFIRPFTVPALGLRGRTVRLGGLVDKVVRRHGYPAPVATLIAEALALVALLGSSLKFDGRFVLQIQNDGPVSFLVADYTGSGDLRATCRFDDAKVATAEPGTSLLGHGQLALTIDQGQDMQSYQGIVPLDGDSLAAAGEAYFRQSEQIPTLIRLAAGEVLGAAAGWRGGGIFLQHLPVAGGTTQSFGDPEADPTEIDRDAWREATALADTIEDHELLDPGLDSDRLLYRLFHERGVHVHDPLLIEEKCRCSRERIETMLSQFTPEEVTDMTVNDEITVTCEFCGAAYSFNPDNVRAGLKTE